MADARRREELSNIHSTSILNYGHPGTSAYLGQNKEWAFLRPLTVDTTPGSSTSAFPFRALNSSSDESNGRDEPHFNNFASPVIASKENPSILEKFVDLRFATKHNPEFEPLSQAILESTERYDPAVGEFLALGRAKVLQLDDVRSVERTCDVIATSGGSNGHEMVLRSIIAQPITIPLFENENPSLRAPGINFFDEAWWSGAGEPIKQIVSSREGRSPTTWLAVRQASSVTLFLPLLHKNPVAARTSGNYGQISSRPVSCLDSNPVLTIPASRTGGYCLADVSFHFRNNNFLAIVDQHGNWSVWKIEGARARSARALYSALLQESGKIVTWDKQKRPRDTRAYHDGWHRILWLESEYEERHLLLICNRRDARLYDQTGLFVESLDLSLGPYSRGHCILDVKSSEKNPRHCYMLTSSRLLWLARGEDEGQGLRILLSWYHFRDKSDMTLRLNIIETDRDTTILLWSPRNSLGVAFRFHLTDAGSPCSSADPLLVNTDQWLTTTRSISSSEVSNPKDRAQPTPPYDHLVSNVSTTFVALECRSHPTLKGSPAPLYAQFTLSSRFQLSQLNYLGIPGYHQIAFQTTRVPLLKIPVTLSNTFNSSRTVDDKEIADEEFIVNDNDKESLANSSMSLIRTVNQFTEPEKGKLNFTSDWRRIYDAAAGLESSGLQLGLTSLETCLADLIRSAAIELGKDTPHRYLLSDLMSWSEFNVVGDQNETTKELGALHHFIGTSIDQNVNGQTLCLGINADEETFSNYDQAYESLMGLFLDSLNEDMPDQLRVARYNLIRNVAVTAVLSSSTINVTPDHPQLSQRSFPVPQPDHLEVSPFTSSLTPIAYRLYPNLGAITQSQKDAASTEYVAHGENSRASTPSLQPDTLARLQTAFNATSLNTTTKDRKLKGKQSSAKMPEIDGTCTRLRAYSTLTKPIAPITKGTVVADIFSHLPGIDTSLPDPQLYDWAEANAMLAKERREEEEAELFARDPRAARKAARKRERESKKGKGTKQHPPSKGPTYLEATMVGSSPVKGIPSIQASSQILLVDASQSSGGVQGRYQSQSQFLAKKAKKRTAGF